MRLRPRHSPALSRSIAEALAPAVLAVAIAALVPAPALAHDFRYWYVHPQQKVYQTSQAPSTARRAAESLSPSAAAPPALTLLAARGEFEGRQIAVRPYQDLRDVWVSCSDLTAVQGATTSVIASTTVEVFKVGYVYIRSASYGYTRVGWEPDPLIPMTLANGQRLGWRKGTSPNPAWRTVASARTQPFYVLFQAPAAAAPGVYRGAITLTATGSSDGEPTPPVRIPVSLTVQPFSIAKRTLKTSFGLSLRWARYPNSPSHDWLAPGSGGPESDRVAERTTFDADQVAGWLRYFSKHRISPQTLLPAWETGRDWQPPDDDGRMRARHAYLDDYLGVGAPTTMSGSRFGFNTVRMPEFETRPAYITNPFSSSTAQSAAARYYSSMKAELGTYASRAYVYPIDEPAASQRSFVERYTALVHRCAPGVKYLCTVDPATFRYQQLRGVDIYVHKLHYYYRDYTKWIAGLRRSRKQVWVYSHMGLQQAGSPTYLIDKPGPDARAQGWFAYDTRADGLLYYSVDRWAGPTKGSNTYRDPYTQPLSLRSSWAGKTVNANGDGSLVYPGYYPSQGLVVQGAPPVGSLRMEALRDGLEDYEYLKLIEARYGRAAAEGYVHNRVLGKPATVPNAGRMTFPAYPKTTWQYEGARNAMAAALR